MTFTNSAVSVRSPGDDPLTSRRQHETGIILQAGWEMFEQWKGSCSFFHGSVNMSNSAFFEPLEGSGQQLGRNSLILYFIGTFLQQSGVVLVWVTEIMALKQNKCNPFVLLFMAGIGILGLRLCRRWKMRSAYVFKYILKGLGVQTKAHWKIYMCKMKKTTMKRYVTNTENITGVWWSGGVPLSQPSCSLCAPDLLLCLKKRTKTGIKHVNTHCEAEF